MSADNRLQANDGWFDQDARSIGKVLANPGFQFAALMNQAARDECSTTALRNWAAAHHCKAPKAVTLNDDTVVVHANDAAQATSLRYRAAELLEFIKQNCSTSPAHISIKVSPHL